MLNVVFGGAFDPPHNEHFNICKACVEELKADRLILVPTSFPPHKSKGFLFFETRVELLKIAYSNFPVPVVIDDIENIRKADNYTSVILPKLKQKYGNVIYLIGGDGFEHFDSWKNPQNIVETAPVAVAGRIGFEDAKLTAEIMRKKFGGDFIILNYVGNSISSAQIKAKLLLGDSSNGVSAEVLEYIRRNNLFNEFKNYVDKLKSFQSDELFEHSKAVVLKAQELNSKHNLKQDFSKIFLAALLHDNAKERLEIENFKVPNEAIGSPVLHQYLGAEKAKRDFGINDNDILSAIECHTSAKPNMTVFEKLIYTADSLSNDRNYPPIPELQKIAEKNFEEGFKAVLKYTYDKIKAKSKGIFPLTAEAVEFYLN